MALYKPHTLSDGVTVSYWVLSQFNIDRRARSVQFTLTPYVSQRARERGRDPVEGAQRVCRVENLDYSIDGPYAKQRKMDYDNFFSPDAIAGKDIYRVVYEYAKIHIPFFENSADI